jgi:hypothetical protein
MRRREEDRRKSSKSQALENKKAEDIKKKEFMETIMKQNSSIRGRVSSS